MRRRARAHALAALLLSGGCAFASVCALPGYAEAQTGVLVVQMPFRGDASQDLLTEAEDATRSALLTRGAQGPDRATVRAAMPVSPPTDTTSITGFGRSMGGTHVLTGVVQPLTGQYNLSLRLYDVATGRSAEQHRNIGTGEEPQAISEMLNALFAPGAMQASPEEQARAEEERRRQEEERRRQEEARRAEEARRREEEERRRRAEEERRNRRHRFAEGGLISVGGGILVGGRISGVDLMPGQPMPSPVVTGLRVEGGYALLPSIGLEVGGALLIVGAPTNAFAIGPSARINVPARGALPLRGSAGVVAGLFQSISGRQATSAWLGADIRAEYDVIPAVTIFAGVSLDGMPGVFSAFSGLIGVRAHFGPTPPPPAAPPSTDASSGTTNAPSAPSSSASP